MTDQETIATAIKAALLAAMPAGVEVYDLDEVPGIDGRPGPIPAQHVEVEVNRHYVEGRRLGGDVTVPGFDLTTRVHGATLTNVRRLRARVTAALENQIIDGDIGPFVFRIGEPEDDDDAGWVGADFWTF